MKRLLRQLLRTFPDAFRERYGEELEEFLELRAADVRKKSGTRGVLRFWLVNVLDLVRAAMAERSEERRRRPPIPRGGSYMSSLWQDVRFGWRMTRRSPGFAIVVVTTLMLGIGANTAVFSVVRGVLMRPLPYQDPGRLAFIYTWSPPNQWPLSVVDFLALQEQQTVFENVGAFTTRGVTYNDETLAERLTARFVTSSFFATLGSKLSLGRTFRPEEGVADAGRTVVVSHGFWNTYLGERDDALGKPIRLDGIEYTLIGVLPDTVGPLEEQADLFPILTLDTPSRKGPFFLSVVARRRAGVEIVAAEEELHAINRRIFPIWKTSYQDESATWGVSGLREFLVNDSKTLLLVLQGAVALILLIAIANVANLMLVRTANRSAELAVRRALGASRRRVVRQLVVESVMLTSFGSIAGTLLAFASTGAVRAAGAAHIPRLAEVGPDVTVLLFAVLITLGSGLLFGAVPALSGPQGLAGSSTRITENAGQRNMRRLFVAFQFALVVPLLFGAGLLTQSVTRLYRVDPGFDATNLLTLRVSLPRPSYPEAVDIRRFWDAAITEVDALPGVVSVGLADSRPPREASQTNNFNLEDQPTPPGRAQPGAPWVTVTPGFFDAVRVPLIQGRMFGNRERDEAVWAVVVDQAWVRRFYPDGDAIGRRFQSGGCTRDDCPWNTVIGVVGDVKFAGLHDQVSGVVYRPHASDTSRTMNLFVRTVTDPVTVLPHVRSVLRSLDPTLAPSSVSTGVQLLSDALEQPRYVAVILGLFAVTALLVASVGIYGVLSYFVRRYTRDIGIRIALGGRPRDVFGLIVGRGMTLVAIGSGAGLLAALAMSRLLSGLLFDTTPYDPGALAAAVALLLAVALATCAAPAFRASRVDPVIALKEE